MVVTPSLVVSSNAVADVLGRSSEQGDAADRFALVHEIERIVDLLDRHLVRDQVIDPDLAVHVPVDDLRHVGAAARAAERGALPHASGHELEWTGLDLLAGAGDTDDDADAPAAVTALQRLPHQIDIADALEAVVRATVGDFDQLGDEIAADFLGIHEVRHAETFGQRFTPRIDIHADDLVRAGEARALNH